MRWEAHRIHLGAVVCLQQKFCLAHLEEHPGRRTLPEQQVTAVIGAVDDMADDSRGQKIARDVMMRITTMIKLDEL